jgi:hypothetical protein
VNSKGRAHKRDIDAVDDLTYWTTKEVAARFRTAPSTVRYWKMIGWGPKGVRCGRKTLYLASEVERFEAELAATANESASADGAA